MPQRKKPNDFESKSDSPKITLIGITESQDAASDRKKRVQALISQMFLRAQKRGRPAQHEMDEELKDAA